MSSPHIASPWKLVLFKDGPNGTTLDQFRELLERTYKDDPLQIIIDLNRANDGPSAPVTGTKMTSITDFLFNQFHLRRAHELVILGDPRAPDQRETNVIWGDDPPGQPYIIGQFLCPKTGLPLGSLENLVIMFGTFAHTGRINNFFRHCTNLRFMTIISNGTPASTRRLPIPQITSMVNPLRLPRLVRADLTVSFAQCMGEMYFQMPALAHLRLVLDDRGAPPEAMMLPFAQAVKFVKLAGLFPDVHLEVFLRYHENIEGLVLDHCPVGEKFVKFLLASSQHNLPFAPNLKHLSIKNATLTDTDVLKICHRRPELAVSLIECGNTSESLPSQPETHGRVTRYATSEDFWEASLASGNPDYPLPMAEEGMHRELYMTEPEL